MVVSPTKQQLDIPELQIQQILSMGADEVHIEVRPIAQKQNCPICRSDEGISLKGNNVPRTIRHLPAFGKKVYLIVPTIRMYCSSCEAGFVWVYEFVGPKRRFSQLFRERAAEQAFGSTAAHSAHMQQAPASTVGRMHNEAVPVESERLSTQAWKQANACRSLVLGVDDFAIRKGHSYNTCIHDLKGETMLDLLPGRKLEDLRVMDPEWIMDKRSALDDKFTTERIAVTQLGAEFILPRHQKLTTKNAGAKITTLPVWSMYRRS